jgi:hypothetical protein
MEEEEEGVFDFESQVWLFRLEYSAVVPEHNVLVGHLHLRYHLQMA